MKQICEKRRRRSFGITHDRLDFFKILKKEKDVAEEWNHLADAHQSRRS